MKEKPEALEYASRRLAILERLENDQSYLRYEFEFQEDAKELNELASEYPEDIEINFQLLVARNYKKAQFYNIRSKVEYSIEVFHQKLSENQEIDADEVYNIARLAAMRLVIDKTFPENTSNLLKQSVEVILKHYKFHYTNDNKYYPIIYINRLIQIPKTVTYHIENNENSGIINEGNVIFTNGTQDYQSPVIKYITNSKLDTKDDVVGIIIKYLTLRDLIIFGETNSNLLKYINTKISTISHAKPNIKESIEQLIKLEKQNPGANKILEIKLEDLELREFLPSRYLDPITSKNHLVALYKDKKYTDRKKMNESFHKFPNCQKFYINNEIHYIEIEESGDIAISELLKKSPRWIEFNYCGKKYENLEGIIGYTKFPTGEIKIGQQFIDGNIVEILSKYLNNKDLARFAHSNKSSHGYFKKITDVKDIFLEGIIEKSINTIFIHENEYYIELCDQDILSKPFFNLVTYEEIN